MSRESTRCHDYLFLNEGPVFFLCGPFLQARQKILKLYHDSQKLVSLKESNALVAVFLQTATATHRRHQVHSSARISGLIGGRMGGSSKDFLTAQDRRC